MPSQSNDGSEGVGDETEAPPIRVPQPPIAHVDRAALLTMLASPIGSESANNAIRPYKLAGTATAKQLARYERTHVLNEETGQLVHKSSALSQLQKQRIDSKLGAGRDRYLTGVRRVYGNQ